MICEVGGEATYAAVMRRARVRGAEPLSSLLRQQFDGRVATHIPRSILDACQRRRASVVPSDRGDPRARRRGLAPVSRDHGGSGIDGQFGYLTLEASRTANWSFFAELGDRSALVVMDTVLCGLITIWTKLNESSSVLPKWQ